MTTITLNYGAMRNKISSAGLPVINWKLIYLFGILSFLLILVFYVFSVNELTKGVYLIKNYSKEINGLLQENKILENNFANSGLFAKNQDRAKELSFEKTTDIKYVQILQSSLAEAR